MFLKVLYGLIFLGAIICILIYTYASWKKAQKKEALYDKFKKQTDDDNEWLDNHPIKSKWIRK